MIMELYQLGYFIEIARQRSFTRAAERLHMAQPALSQQMKNLESELGTALFIRGRKEIQLTAAGKAFLPRAEALLTQAEAAKVNAMRARSGAVFLVDERVFMVFLYSTI
jgi:DNA-binding transcriptional LysR family regulator